MLTWFAWGLGMLTIPGANWSHWLIAMGMATLVGQLVRYGRRGNLETASDAVNLQMIGLLADAQELAEGRQALLATISHDVRTPVTGIVGMVDLLLQRPLDARTRELVSGVQHSADGLTTMLNNLLDLARVEAGRLRFTRTTRISARWSVRSCRWSDRSYSASRYAHRCFEPGSRPVGQHRHEPLPADPAEPASQRREIHRERGHRRLATTCGRWSTVGEVLVTDTGPGMSPENNPAPSTCSFKAAEHHRRHGGSGLSLAIAQRLTTALGGSTQIKSELGEGTVFRIQLPVGEISSDHLNPNVRIPGEAVVSGHPVAVRAVSMALQRFGKQVVPECTGKPGTLHPSGVGHRLRTGQPRYHDGHRLIVLGPTVTVAAAPTAGGTCRFRGRRNGSWRFSEGRYRRAWRARFSPCLPGCASCLPKMTR